MFFLNLDRKGKSSRKEYTWLATPGGIGSRAEK